jgi:hypothetical protein
MNKKDVNLRIGNISFVHYDNDDSYDILKYNDNPYYGKENEYEPIKIESETDDNEERYTPKDNYGSFIVDKSLFIFPEISHVIAQFIIDKETGSANLLWIEQKPLKLSKEDFEIFMYCVKFGYNYIEEIVKPTCGLEKNLA